MNNMIPSKEAFLQQPTPQHPLLRALYLDALGKWDQAHALVDTDNNQEAAWIHAYLHRVEGDHWNAQYWYNKAGRPPSDDSLEEEWLELFSYFYERYNHES